MLDVVFQFVIELFVEGVTETSLNKRVSKIIRYPISFLLILFFSFIIFGLLCYGIITLKENIVSALLYIMISLFLFIGIIIKFKDNYLIVNKGHK